MDSAEGALRLASQTPNILCNFATQEKMASRFASVTKQVKKSSKLIFCGVYYLCVLVCTSRLGECQPLATDTEGNRCRLVYTKTVDSVEGAL